MNTVDLTDVSLDAFVRFLFDRPVVPVPDDVKDEPTPWYFLVETEHDSDQVADLYIELFTSGALLLSRFSDEQLDQGFWAVHGCNLDCSAANIIWEPGVPFRSRAAVVRSMQHLFASFLATRHLDTAVDMWWDSLAYDWHCGNRARSNGGEDKAMQDVMFETLCTILECDAPHIQYSALHGLGHLHHPHTKAVIEDWLRRCTPGDEELVAYANSAARFEVM